MTVVETPAVPEASSFTQVLNAAISRNRWNREGPAPAWYPSNLGGCDRKGVFRRAGVKGTPFDLRTLRKFWMGDQVHKALQDAIKQELIAANAGFTFVGHELRIRDDEYHISGRLDTLVIAPDGVEEPWEFKSVASGAFQYGDFPKPEHLLQLGVYLTFPSNCESCEGKGRIMPTDPGQLKSFIPGMLPLCSECGGRGKRKLPERGRLIFWSKDDALMEEYPVWATPELRSNVKETLRRLEEHYQLYLKDKTTPPVLPMVQALKKDPETGRQVPFIYVKNVKKDGVVIHHKGDPKMEFDHRCAAAGRSTFKCEFFNVACVPADWGLTSPAEVTTGPDEGTEEA